VHGRGYYIIIGPLNQRIHANKKKSDPRIIECRVLDSIAAALLVLKNDNSRLRHTMGYVEKSYAKEVLSARVYRYVAYRQSTNTTAHELSCSCWIGNSKEL
jgi:hypothetical protein